MERTRTDQVSGAISSQPSPLLALFHPDPVEAEQLLEALRVRIIKLLRCRGCTEPDDVWGETVLIVMKKLVEGVRMENVSGFFWRVALVTYQSRRARTRVTLVIDDVPADVIAIPPRLRDDVFLERLKACFQQLKALDRALIAAEVRGENRTDLATRHGVRPATLRVRLHRARNSLRECLERSGIVLEGEARNL